MNAAQEIELKLEVEPDDLPLVHQNPLLANAECHTTHQVTIYYDTPKTRLKKHGFTLRVRSSGGRFVQTIKSITGSIGLLCREEIECAVTSLKPDLDSLLHHPIHALVRNSEADNLREVIRTEVDRTSWQVDRRDHRMQVDLDHGTITAGGRCAEFAELEFELRDGPPASLIVAARRLSEAVPVRLGVLTKAERGSLIAEDSFGKIHKAAPIHVHPDMSVADAFEVIIHACLKHYRLNEPLVIRDLKARALHQARVAMRRLRSAFTLFRPAVDDVEFQHLRHELRWFTSQLGDARNLDVYLERDLQEKERARLFLQREKVYQAVICAMNSDKFRRLMIDLVGWTAVGAWRNAKPAQSPIQKFAKGRLNRLWGSIASAGRHVTRMDECARHELRIQVKKMRYAIEFLQGLYPYAHSAEKHFETAVAELQETLGKLNDMVTATNIGGGTENDGWLIGSFEERQWLAAAEDALNELLKIGPFWRARERADQI